MILNFQTNNLLSFIVKCWIILRNCVQVTLMSIEVNQFFGITRKSRQRINLYFGHIFFKRNLFCSRLISQNGKFLSLDNLPVKYNVHLKFLQYFQLIAAIRSCLKKIAQEIAVTKRDLLKEQEVFYFSDNRPLSLTKLRCKDYYNLFQEGKTTEPTAVKRWSSFFPYFDTSWKQSLNTFINRLKTN